MHSGPKGATRTKCPTAGCTEDVEFAGDDGQEVDPDGTVWRRMKFVCPKGHVHISRMPK